MVLLVKIPKRKLSSFLRQNNWITRNLVVAGNFNLTNVDELFDVLLKVGQHPKEMSDTVTVLEKIGHFLDVENDELYRQFKKDNISNQEVYEKIAKHIGVKKSSRKPAKIGMVDMPWLDCLGMEMHLF